MAGTRKWREANPEQSREINLRAQRKRQALWAQLLDEWKSQPCMDCGHSFPTECMDFDHRPGEKKLFGVNRAGAQRPVKALIAERAKCDLVCANCHRIRTKKRGQGAIL